VKVVQGKREAARQEGRCIAVSPQGLEQNHTNAGMGGLFTELQPQQQDMCLSFMARCMHSLLCLLVELLLLVHVAVADRASSGGTGCISLGHAP
jgi:hypothetical protein